MTLRDMIITHYPIVEEPLISYVEPTTSVINYEVIKTLGNGTQVISYNFNTELGEMNDTKRPNKKA